jgi:hypothetical protein
LEQFLSVIPIEAYEGTKAPDTLRLPHPHDPITGRIRPSWSIFQIRRPTSAELQHWCNLGGSYGLAVVGGTVSGGQRGLGLEVIDFDTADLVGPWTDLVEKQIPGLVSRLVKVRTPRPGIHVYYRCLRYGVSQKLACAVATDESGHTAVERSGRPVCRTLIEVKAEGGYCLIPPSPPRCHPSCRLYRYAESSPELTAVPTITPAERQILLDAARALNQYQEPAHVSATAKARRKNTGVLLPGNDFNARASWHEVLTPHGWTLVGSYGDEERWCRPGKDGCVSATTNHNGCGLLHVFTSNAPCLDADRGYAKFSAYAFLNHHGDFKAAARDLEEQGYGTPRLQAGRR